MEFDDRIKTAPVYISWNGEEVKYDDIIKFLPNGQILIRNKNVAYPLSWLFGEFKIATLIFFTSKWWKWRNIKIWASCIKENTVEYIRPTKIVYVGHKKNID